MVATALAGQAQARDYISIVGSSTVYPFATVVAEQFGKITDFKTPKSESTDSEGGLKLFCAGVGVEHPDVTNASRRIRRSEVDKCAGNGVNDIVEVRIGYDGIVFANSRESEPVQITRKQIFLALAKDVPDPNGGETLVPNPYTKWSEPDASLPDAKIEVLGPPPTSGTRDAFAELALEGGCKIEKRFNTAFFTAGDSREPELAGIRGAAVGSFYTLNAVGAENMDLRVVMHGNGLTLLMRANEDPNFESGVANLKSQGIGFKVCANTLKGRKISYEDDLYDVDQEDIVPSGVAEVAHLQAEGYSYVKP